MEQTHGVFRMENPALSAANQIARFIKTNACHIINIIISRGVHYMKQINVQFHESYLSFKTFPLNDEVGRVINLIRAKIGENNFKKMTYAI